MTDRILHQRLQYQIRHPGIEQLRIDADLDDQAITESNFLDLDIAIEELQLLLQRNLLHADVLERVPEQIAQSSQHALRSLDVSMHECGDSVECVEQEVWVELHLQTVLGFTLALSFFTGLVFDTVPALLVSRADLSESLKEGGRSTAGEGGHRLRSLLVVSEIALALVLLIGIALMMRSFFNVTEQNPGFNTGNLLTMTVSLPPAKYEEDHRQAAFFEELNERVATLPGVDSVAMSLPLLGGWQNVFVIEGRPAPPAGEEWLTEVMRVSPDYFETMQVLLLRGRTFTKQDREDSTPVAIVDETLADSYWPGEDPIGKRVKFGNDPGSEDPWMEVVGVVGHVKNYGVDAESRIELYVPHRQALEWMAAMSLLVRTSGPPAQLAKSVTQTVLSMDPDQPVFDVMTMEQNLGRRLTARRLSLVSLGVFAGVAILLAAVGIYGLMAYSVTQKTHEIGIRLALGAQARDVLRMMMGQGLILAGLGVGLGLLAAFALTPLMTTAGLLFGPGSTYLWRARLPFDVGRGRG